MRTGRSGADDDDMTQEQVTAPGPTAAYPPPGPAHLLRRSRTNRKIAGVAGGLGRYADVDPLILRILFVVLTIFGGSGLLLYALGWFFIPDDGEQESEGQRLFSGRGGRTAGQVVGLVLLVVIGLIVVGASVDSGPGFSGLGVLVVVAVATVLLLRNGDRPTSQPAAPPVPPTGDPGAYGQTTGTAYAPSAPLYGPPPPPVGPTAMQAGPPVPPAPPRERSVLGRLTVSVALITVGLMVAWNILSAGTDDDFRAVAVFATALAVVATGLLVGSVRGRARGLILLAVPLAVLTIAAGAADDHLSSGVGERSWAPTNVAAAEREFRLGVGEAELDLTGLPAGSQADVEVRLGVGELTVLVPPDATVVVEGGVGAGTMTLLGDATEDGTDLQDTARQDPVGDPSTGTTITIDAEVGLGELEVQ